jgi:hypothetical protein
MTKAKQKWRPVKELDINGTATRENTIPLAYLLYFVLILDTLGFV